MNMSEKKLYFVSYVIHDGGQVTFHNGHVSPDDGINTIIDIGKIEFAIENDRGLPRNTVTIINYLLMEELT